MSLRKGKERFLEAYLPAGKSASDYITLPFGVLPNAPSYDIVSIRGREWMAKSMNIFVVDKEALIRLDESFSPYLNGIIIGADSVYMNQTFSSTNQYGKRYPVMNHDGVKTVEFPYRLNDVSFYWTTNYYVNEEKTQYRFFLKGNDKEWSKWDNVLYKDFNNLRYGHYQFKLQARSATGLVSEETVFEFIILKPWYATFIAIIFYILAVAGIVLIIIKAYTKRTAEVVKQKEELESSIHYASRIQMALLPSEKILSENIKNYFVLFKPRDIVSGDFYWMTKRNDKLFIVAADCTGHGVPGAFMSLLGMSFLDEIVNKSSIQRADLILKELRIHVTNSLKQVGEDDEAKDGMDMALLMVDFVAGKVEFSGAYNPCFKIRKLSDSEINGYTEGKYDSEEGVMSNGRYLLDTVFATKMPIGISARMKEDFILHQWDMEKGVSYYLFSDGYVDQFGSNGRKFMKKNFKKLLLDIQEYPMAKQKDILEETLRQWMGDTPQIDDILVMGLRTD
jgi:serine phosphatase RsbU (regulator of sigma subunit)